MRVLFALLTAAAITQALQTWAGPALAAGNPESVEIPQKDGGRLKAVLFRPDGEGPFPAVIGLHNCTGLINAAGAIGSRYRDWGQRLSKGGYAVLLPDSNGSRGLGSQCSSAARAIRADRERAAGLVPLCTRPVPSTEKAKPVRTCSGRLGWSKSWCAPG